MRYAVVLNNKVSRIFLSFEEANKYVRFFFPDVKWEKIYPYIWYATESPAAIVELPYYEPKVVR